MAKRTTGITKNSTKYFVVDAGAIYVNYGETDERLLGATSGGTAFKIETEMHQIEVDGLKTALKGGMRITKVTATIEGNLMELSPQNLQLALAGAEITEHLEEGSATATHDSIRRKRDLTDADYLKNVAIVGRVNNNTENFVGILYNAIGNGGIEVQTENEGEAVIEIVFTATCDVEDIQDDGTILEPWEIRFPKVQGVETPTTQANEPTTKTKDFSHEHYYAKNFNEDMKEEN